MIIKVRTESHGEDPIKVTIKDGERVVAIRGGSEFRQMIISEFGGRGQSLSDAIQRYNDEQRVRGTDMKAELRLAGENLESRADESVVKIFSGTRQTPTGSQTMSPGEFVDMAYRRGLIRGNAGVEAAIEEFNRYELRQNPQIGRSRRAELVPAGIIPMKETHQEDSNCPSCGSGPDLYNTGRGMSRVCDSCGYAEPRVRGESVNTIIYEKGEWKISRDSGGGITISNADDTFTPVIDGTTADYGDARIPFLVKSKLEKFLKYEALAEAGESPNDDNKGDQR